MNTYSKSFNIKNGFNANMNNSGFGHAMMNFASMMKGNGSKNVKAVMYNTPVNIGSKKL